MRKGGPREYLAQGCRGKKQEEWNLNPDLSSLRASTLRKHFIFQLILITKKSRSADTEGKKLRDLAPIWNLKKLSP